MEERQALEKRRQELLARRGELEAAMAGAQGPALRKLRVERALVGEELLGIQDQLTARRELERERREEPPAPPRRVRRAARSKEEEDFLRLLRELSASAEPREGLSLAELGRSYRAQADALRHRIQIVEEMRARGKEAQMAKEERLRLLRAMLRDVREVAVICERYYEPGYYRPERYRP